MPLLEVTATMLNVRSQPALSGQITGSLRLRDRVEELQDSPDGLWKRVRQGALEGWSSTQYLRPVPGPGPLQPLIDLADASPLVHYPWRDRGRMPIGYLRGMALTYGLVYCHWSAGEAGALDMARAATTDTQNDALAHYAAEFQAAGLSNDQDGADTLRHLFVLLMGLGMRESSGRWCEGRDTSANNTSADTAEAGLFQTSWNAHAASPLLPALFEAARTRAASFDDVFHEGVQCSAQNLQNFGSGDGQEFQRLSKASPAFAAEFAAIGLRHLRRHWGPINQRTAELRPEADQLYAQVQAVVDGQDLCARLTAS